MVHRIQNDKLLSEPVLGVNVANVSERGLLGIAVANPNSAAENGDEVDSLVSTPWNLLRFRFRFCAQSSGFSFVNIIHVRFLASSVCV